MAEKIGKQYFADSTINPDIKSELEVTGFGCAENNTLLLLALDSLKYHHFAESLGIDVLNNYHKTAVVIVDEKVKS